MEFLNERGKTRRRIWHELEDPILEAIKKTLLEYGFTEEQAEEATEDISNSSALDVFVQPKVEAKMAETGYLGRM